jgi:hypothetical protein
MSCLAVVLWTGANWHNSVHALEDFIAAIHESADEAEAHHCEHEHCEHEDEEHHHSQSQSHSHSHSHSHKECFVCQVGMVSVETPSVSVAPEPIEIGFTGIVVSHISSPHHTEWILPLGHGPPPLPA